MIILLIMHKAYSEGEKMDYGIKQVAPESKNE